MKRHHLVIIVCSLWLAVGFPIPQSYGRDVVKGQITDAMRERIALSAGDRVAISVGRDQGLIKGDIGKILSSKNGSMEVGRCVIAETNKGASICEIIESFREVGRGDGVVFEGVDYRDPRFFLPIVDFLDSSVKSYPIHEKVTILVHEIYDDRNNVTALSEKVRDELIFIASQKKRLTVLNGRETTPAILYYPNEYASSASHVKEMLKKKDAHMLVTGNCSVKDTALELALQRIKREGDDRVLVFPLSLGAPSDPKQNRIILPYTAREKPVDSACSILYKPRHYVPLKEEKGTIIRDEAGGDPFKELALKRVEFNIISPVDFTFAVDDTVIPITDSGTASITLGSGSHRIHASFKRGYFSNDSLLYTSSHQASLDALLELNKDNEIVVEVAADPLPDKQDPLSFKVYRKIESERHTLIPIKKIHAERRIETFVE